MTFEQAIQLAEQYHQTGQLDAAENVARQVTQQVPQAAAGWNILGLILVTRNRMEEAQNAYQEAIRQQPDFIGAWSNWSLLLRAQGKFGQAIECLQHAAALQPHPGVLCNLATVLLEAGQVPEALATARRGLALAPDFMALHSGLIMALHYHPPTTARDIRAELDRWRTRFADPLRHEIRPHANDRSPDRRLRIGYVSADMRHHSVGRFLAPVLAAHDPAVVEIFCYTDVMLPDPMTQRLQRSAHQWRSISGQSDAAVADLIRTDAVDILVDLSLHTHGNRLLVFARKPAPIQATWLAYAGSTGLATVDYRLSDHQLDPPAANTDEYTETTLRLESFWCYEAPDASPAVGPLPADRGQGVTFGSLNLLAKVSDLALATWGQILSRLPGSKLILHATSGSHRQRLLSALEKWGVTPDRLQLVERLPMADFLRLHDQIDIGLDPFPFGGGTTTCDALWMGVPMITLKGQLGVGRGGASLLARVDLPELVAPSLETYVEIAVKLGGDLPRLRSIRQSLRQRMQNSVLMNAPRCARSMEFAYRQMWNFRRG